MTRDYYLREATPADAEAIIAFMKTIADEPDNGTTFVSADQFVFTPQEESEILRQHQKADNSLWIVAVDENGEIVGSLNATGGRRTWNHVVGIGISVAKVWRNRGVGTAMMQFIIDWCRATPAVHRLELTVFSNNPSAIHVYEKLGFQREGVRRHAYLKHGDYLDGILMAIVFE